MTFSRQKVEVVVASASAILLLLLLLLSRLLVSLLLHLLVLRLLRLLVLCLLLYVGWPCANVSSRLVDGANGDNSHGHWDNEVQKFGRAKWKLVVAIGRYDGVQKAKRQQRQVCSLLIRVVQM